MQSVQPAVPCTTAQGYSLSEAPKTIKSEFPQSTFEPETREQNNSCDEPVPVYSVLPNGEKTFVIMAGSFAALISPLSSSIYLPALDSLARDMDASVSLINLTITTYLVGFICMCIVKKMEIDLYYRFSKALRPLSSEAFLIVMDAA